VVKGLVSVESGDQRVQRITTDGQVDAATDLLLGRGGGVVARAIHAVLQAAGESDERIAQGFAAETSHAHVGQQVIIGVLGRGAGGRHARASEGLGEEHLSKQGLHGPLLLDETPGEMVEELGVRGLVTETA